MEVVFEMYWDVFEFWNCNACEMLFWNLDEWNCDYIVREHEDYKWSQQKLGSWLEDLLKWFVIFDSQRLEIGWNTWLEKHGNWLQRNGSRSLQRLA